MADSRISTKREVSYFGPIYINSNNISRDDIERDKGKSFR